MLENEDVILPDDFDAKPEAEEVTETVEEDGFESVETVDDTKPTEETEKVQQETQPQTIKIKYNHMEREIPLSEAEILAQKGLNYEKAVERARQESRDAFIAEQGYEWNGKPITTEQQYNDALKEQELIQKYQDQNLPDEVIQELVESRKFREQSQEERQRKEEETKVNADFQDFFAYFKQANGKDWSAEQDPIPSEVWETVNKGVPLKYAYMEHVNNQLQSQVKVLKQNKENETKAPISGVTGHGSQEVSSTDPFLLGFDSI